MPVETRWAIAEGDYSDYRVLAVFDDKATAEAWLAKINEAKPDEDFVSSYTPSLEEIAFVTAGTEPKEVSSYQLDITLWDDGRIERRDVRVETALPIRMAWTGPPPKRPRVRFVRAPMHGGKGGRMEVFGDSLKAVEKVAADRIAAWKAGSWLTKTLQSWNSEEEEG